MRSYQHLSVVVGLSVFWGPLSALAATYYVSPTGSDTTGAGTLASPWASFAKAQTGAMAGDTVYFRGGIYAFTGTGTVGFAFTKSGSAGSLIKYWAYDGETPIVDLRALTPSNRVTGLDVKVSYVHIKGFAVTGVRQYVAGSDSWGVRIQGSNNILENLNVHHNDAPGIFITSGANNLVVNCDSHHNYDVLESGGSGDGFGCHSSGSGNVMRACRAYDNSDDGFDFINAAGSCLVEKSFSFRNGFIPDTTTAIGNGAGFKAGGYGSPPVTPSAGAATHTVQQCVAFGNRSQGFYANHHPGRINFYNNTAFNNPTNYNMLADSGYPSDHVIRNNIAMTSGTAISNLTGGTATYNSWNLSVTVSTADFISVVQSEAMAARLADGSLPLNNFMRLATGSDLIDKGTDVGLAFSGTAPDLGAFETGTASTGGTTSTGGTSSVGGTTAKGGASSIGGTTNASTVAAAGGSVAAGGSGAGGQSVVVATGGTVAAAGATATGGAVASTTAIVASAGNVGVGGASAASTGVIGGDTSGDQGSCSCRVPAASSSNVGGLALLGAALLGLKRRRRG